MMELHLLHPMAVHFPIVLLLSGGIAALGGRLKKAPPWAEEASQWLLGLGTLSCWAAFWLGVLAEETAVHVPTAWMTLSDHENMAFWAAILFTVLSAVRLWGLRKPKPFARYRTFYVLLWVAALGVIFRTAHLGGELVYTHGMGVAEAEEDD